MTRSLLLAMAALVATGCSSLVDIARPDVALADVRMGEMSLLESQIIAEIRIDNANLLPLIIDGSVHELYIDGKRVGRALSDERLELNRLSSQTMTVRLNVDNLAMVTRLRPIIEQQHFDYRLDSMLHVEYQGYRKQLRVQREGTLDADDFAAPKGTRQ